MCVSIANCTDFYPLLNYILNNIYLILIKLNKKRNRYPISLSRSSIRVNQKVKITHQSVSRSVRAILTSCDGISSPRSLEQFESLAIRTEVIQKFSSQQEHCSQHSYQGKPLVNLCKGNAELVTYLCRVLSHQHFLE